MGLNTLTITPLVHSTSSITVTFPTTQYYIHDTPKNTPPKTPNIFPQKSILSRRNPSKTHNQFPSHQGVPLRVTTRGRVIGYYPL